MEFSADHGGTASVWKGRDIIPSDKYSTFNSKTAVAYLI